MKKLLLVTLLLTIFEFNAQNFSMIDQGNRWTVEITQFCGDLPDCNDFEISGYRTNGQEVINEITYTTIEFYNTFTNQWQFSSYLREEASTIYILSTNQDEESILYDFTLEVGDSASIIPVEDTNQNGLADVTAVTNEFIAGEMRKVITFDVPTPDSFISDFEQWIEGIGSTTNLINPFRSVIDASYNLGCFGDGIEFFPFSEEGNCSLLNISEVPEITASLTPNPIRDQSTLTINNFQNNTIISFYNVLGQYINRKKIITPTTIINHNDFPSSGIYFYQIEQNGVILDTQKFIVK
ncbi:T9SS type A sorting domain-containing protein [uncultured Dokdonia sp.]|uniref:T9SS type A sorting domain-containing protein n=1 Tax=uncultured Dokdonia sp. TaxID=575653 RepID=UPI0026270F15|nr:T9SS type A sorting domain-containing protein [uncultured Dokdonia sp.]